VCVCVCVCVCGLVALGNVNGTLFGCLYARPIEHVSKGLAQESISALTYPLAENFDAVDTFDVTHRCGLLDFSTMA